MKHILETFVRISLFVLTIFVWSWVLQLRLSSVMDVSIIVGGILLVFPIAWLGRMVLTVLALGISLRVWFQSLWFVLWVLLLLVPALLSFVKIYEERELEIRFGASYLEYKFRTPMLIPRRPGN